MNLTRKQKKVRDKERREAVRALWETDRENNILLTLQDGRHDKKLTLVKEMYKMRMAH